MVGIVAELRDLRKHLRHQRAGWTPSMRPVPMDDFGVELNSLEDIPLGQGLIFDEGDISGLGATLTDHVADRGRYIFPRKINWRKRHRRRWVSPVQHQRACNACVAFTVCDVMEAMHRLDTGVSWKGGALSKGDLFSCGGGCCVKGWYFQSALAHAQIGVPAHDAAPHRPGTAPCSRAPAKLRVTSVFRAETLEERKYLLLQGPVMGAMVVSEEFKLYEAGVYCSSTPFKGRGHAMTFIGYDDDLRCWHVKNSWGQSWGKNGFGCISYDEPSVFKWPFYSVTVSTIP